MTAKKNVLFGLKEDVEKKMQILYIGETEIAMARSELEEFKKLKWELLNEQNGDYYLKEQVIQLRYQNQILKE